MEELIKQAFTHVEIIGPQVADGQYDLVAPDGGIILPQIWESVIRPGWNITMHMWPMREPKPPRPFPRHGIPPPPPGSRPGPPLPPPGMGQPVHVSKKEDSPVRRPLPLIIPLTQERARS
jgi:hypothetical protein